MKIHISHKRILDPQACNQEIGKLTHAILGVSDALVAANLAVYLLLNAQVVSDEDAPEWIAMLKALGGKFAAEGNVEAPLFGVLLRTVAEVVHQAGLGSDSLVTVASDGTVSAAPIAEMPLS